MCQKGEVAVWDPVPGRYRGMYPQRAYAMVPGLPWKDRQRGAADAGSREPGDMGGARRSK